MSIYRQGRINITNGSAIIEGLGTRWLNYCANAVDITVNGVTRNISSVNDQNELSLSEPWDGATETSVRYSITTVDLTKQDAFAQTMRRLQNEIYDLQRSPVSSDKSDGPGTSLYYATDNFRYKLANPESIGVDPMGGVRFWGADGYDHTVGIGWFDNFNPLVNIMARDKLLDTQLYDARDALVVMLNDIGTSAEEIALYNPAFTLPSYPYV